MTGAGLQLNHLPDVLQELFHRVHAKHLKMMGTDERAKHSIENVTRVLWDEEEQCLKVYYKEGDWWHYTASGEFY
ncbi:hypothetical protein [Sporosarcina aquimarina]|uniref:hypothetical protein n=1 Tax=Sporosarcina aquimarina TaxID=114975 RepID=UPI001C8DDAD4|nr:hypothetical protein [Sporosarcina aquimarina]MBY0224118.1 hypothetical protein [Sporosarcina aquimarina]